MITLALTIALLLEQLSVIHESSVLGAMEVIGLNKDAVRLIDDQSEKEIKTMERAFFCAFLAEKNIEIENSSAKSIQLFNLGVDAGRSFFDRNEGRTQELFGEMGAKRVTSDMAIGVLIAAVIGEVDDTMAKRTKPFDVERAELFRRRDCVSLINDKQE